MIDAETTNHLTSGYNFFWAGSAIIAVVGFFVAWKRHRNAKRERTFAMGGMLANIGEVGHRLYWIVAVLLAGSDPSEAHAAFANEYKWLLIIPIFLIGLGDYLQLKELFGWRCLHRMTAVYILLGTGLFVFGIYVKAVLSS